MIIQHGKLEVQTKKGSMTIEEFERMPNAAKRHNIPKMAVGDLFMPVLDTDFRNGIGHHSAHYEQEPDAIVIFDAKDSGKVTEFCRKVLDLFAAFELAVRFHHDIHIHLEGRFAQVLSTGTYAPFRGACRDGACRAWRRSSRLVGS
jgi:hypothetical protein